MSRSKKSYTDLQAQMQKLLEEQENMKNEKLDIFLNMFRKEFKKKSFQELLVHTDDDVLKEAAKNIINGMPSIINRAEGQIEQKKAEQKKAETMQQQSSNFVQNVSGSEDV